MLRWKYVAGDLLAAGSAALLMGMTGQALGQSAQTEKVKPGDRVIFAAGEHQGQPARIELVLPGNPPVAALPADPATGTVRDGSRFNAGPLDRRRSRLFGHLHASGLYDKRLE